MMTLIRHDEELVRSEDACKLAGITYRQLDYWARVGVVTPIVEANGSGTTRRYTEDQVEQLRIVGALREIGIPLERIRDIGPRACLIELLEDLQDLAEGVL